MAAVVISLMIQKGGTGKSVTSLNLASELAEQGNKVLLIDFDSQGTSTKLSGVEFDEEKTIINVIADIVEEDKGDKKDPIDPNDVIYPAAGGFSVLPSSPSLANLENKEEVNYFVMKNLIKPYKRKFDYIIIDTPPALGNCLKMAAVASDYIIIPVLATASSIEGLYDFELTFLDIKRYLNKKLRILGILLCQFDTRTKFAKVAQQVFEEESARLKTSVFDTKIRKGVAVEEALAFREPLKTYAPKSKPRLDYKAFADEVAERISNNG